MKYLVDYLPFVFPVYPIIAFVSIYFFNAAIDNVIGGVVIIVALLFLLESLTGRYIVKFPKYLMFYFLFCLYVTVSFFLVQSDTIGANFWYSFPYLKSFIILLLIENTFLGANFIKFSNIFILLTIAIAGIVMIAQISDPFFLSSPLTQAFFKNIETKSLYRDSIFGWISINALSLSFIPIYSIIIEQIRKNLMNKLIMIAGLVISFFSGARSVIVEYVIITALYFAKNSKIKLFSIIKITFYTVIGWWLLSSLISMIGFDINLYLNDRLLSGSAESRLIAIDLFNKFFPNNPVLGTGGVQEMDLILERAGRTSQIHVGFLSLFYYYGLVGGGIYLLFIFFLFKHLFMIAKKTDYWGSIYAIFSFMIANLTLVSLHLFEYGLILAMYYNRYYIIRSMDTANQIKK